MRNIMNDELAVYSDQFLRLLIQVSIGKLEEDQIQNELCGTVWAWDLLETPLEHFVSEN